MDLIYADADRADVGVLTDYDLDLAFGADENNFECKVVTASHCCREDWIIYVDGTEYGGIIDSIEVDTGSDQVTYSGRTWHGIIDSKIIIPDSGQAYLIVSGDANDVIASILSRCGLTSLFQADTSASNIIISGYKMDRYIPAYRGLQKMLASVGAKLRLSYVGGMVLVSATPRLDQSGEEELTSDQLDFVAKRIYNPVNHLVCLGSGELENRVVRHLYTNANGEISQTQTFFGLDEVADIFDYPSAESEDELIDSGTDRLAELSATSYVSVDFTADSDNLEVGDMVCTYDHITGILVSATISKKIVTITGGVITIMYKVGD